MTAEIDIDHTSFAVNDVLAWARQLRRDLGAIPIAGEVLAEFRYLLLYVGTAGTGARIELMEPVGDGFLTRFLDRRGPGPHHITFTVPDLRSTVAEARALGATVVGEDYTDTSWQEAFIPPDDKHRVVIQLAQSDVAYPTTAELLATSRRETDTFASSPDAAEPLWWASIWDTPPRRAAILGATHLASADLGHARALFGDLLGAVVSESCDSLVLTWPSGSIHVHTSDQPGIVGMDLRGDPDISLRIGHAFLGPSTTERSTQPMSAPPPPSTNSPRS